MIDFILDVCESMIKWFKFRNLYVWYGMTNFVYLGLIKEFRCYVKNYYEMGSYNSIFICGFCMFFLIKS